MADIDEQIWTGELMLEYEKDTSFLSLLDDQSRLVERNNTINLGELGADPQVFINNTTYPISTVNGGARNIAITLDQFDTENTRIRDEDLRSTRLDIIGGYTTRHAQILLENIAKKGAHAIAPASHSSNTPVLFASGATDGNELAPARKKIVKKDLINLKKAFDLANVPIGQRYLLLCPEHVAQILEFDENFARQYQNITDGKVLPLYGFKIYEVSFLPQYNASGAKKAFGSASVPATDCYASVAFHLPEVYKAMSAVEMYYQFAKQNTSQRATEFGFRQYGIVMPKRNKGLGALVSPPTA